MGTFDNLKKALEACKSYIELHLCVRKFAEKILERYLDGDKIAELQKISRRKFEELRKTYSLLSYHTDATGIICELVMEYPDFVFCDCGKVGAESAEGDVKRGTVTKWRDPDSYWVFSELPDNKTYTYDEAKKFLGSCWLQKVYEDTGKTKSTNVWLNQGRYFLWSTFSEVK